MRRVRLHIDRLTIDGVAGLNRGQLGVAVERELLRLLAERPLAAPMAAAHARADGGSIALAPAPTPAGVGAQIGRAVHGAVTGPGARGGRTR